VPPQRNVPTPQQNFLTSTPQQSNLPQISPHVSGNTLPLNGAVAQIGSAPPQQSPQITHPPTQPLNPLHKIPPLPEDRFKSVFSQFTAATRIRLTERDLLVEGRQANLWALHKAVFMRNGYEAVRLTLIP